MCQNHLPDQLVLPSCRRCGCRLRPPTVPLQCLRTCPAARGCSCLRLSPDPKHNKPESNLRRLQVISRPQTQQLQSTKPTGYLQTPNPTSPVHKAYRLPPDPKPNKYPQSLQVIHLQTQNPNKPNPIHKAYRSSISRPKKTTSPVQPTKAYEPFLTATGTR